MGSAKKLDRLKSKAREIKRNLFVLYFAYRDPRVSWFAKMFAVLVVAYAFSPIDLIPDFVPVLGYLDDLILVPLGIILALKMIPQAVIDDCRAKAEEARTAAKPKNWAMGVLFILIWLLLVLWVGSVLFKSGVFR